MFGEDSETYMQGLTVTIMGGWRRRRNAKYPRKVGSPSTSAGSTTFRTMKSCSTPDEGLGVVPVMF